MDLKWLSETCPSVKKNVKNPEQSYLSLIMILVLALIKIFCAYSYVLYYICCHVVAHELDVSKLISIRVFDKTPRIFVTLPNRQFENDLMCQVLKLLSISHLV